MKFLILIALATAGAVLALRLESRQQLERSRDRDDLDRWAGEGGALPSVTPPLATRAPDV
jgi:hypothetical protein